MTPRILLLALALTAAGCSSGDDTATTTDATAASSPATTSAIPSDTTADTNTTDATLSGTATSVATASTTTPKAPTTTTTATTTTTEVGDPTVDTELTDAEVAERDLARAALITLADFPDGWVEEPPDDDENDDEPDQFETEFDACLGRDDEDLIGDQLQRIVAATGDFHPVDDDTTQVSHEVVLAPDATTAIDRMAEVDVTGGEACVADVIRRFYETLAADEPDLDGITVGEVVVTRTEREREPDLAVGVLIEIPLTVEGQTVSQFLEFLYQRQGRALSELSFSSFAQPFSRDGYTALSDEVVIGLATIGD